MVTFINRCFGGNEAGGGHIASTELPLLANQYQGSASEFPSHSSSSSGSGTGSGSGSGTVLVEAAAVDLVFGACDNARKALMAAGVKVDDPCACGRRAGNVTIAAQG